MGKQQVMTMMIFATLMIGAQATALSGDVMVPVRLSRTVQGGQNAGQFIIYDAMVKRNVQIDDNITTTVHFSDMPHAPQFQRPFRPMRFRRVPMVNGGNGVHQQWQQRSKMCFDNNYYNKK